MQMRHLSKNEAEGFYAVHRERPFFPSLTTFMSSGPVVVLALEAPDAIEKWRTLMGATDPAKADAGTLRKEFGSFDREQRHARLGRARHRCVRAGLLLPRRRALELTAVGRLLVVVGVVIAGIGSADDGRRPLRAASRGLHVPARKRDVLLSAGDVHHRQHHPDTALSLARFLRRSKRRPVSGGTASDLGRSSRPFRSAKDAADVDQVGSVDQEDGNRAPHDRSVRGSAGAGGRRLVRAVVVRL